MIYQLHIASDIKPEPSDHEISAALILSEYFQTDITFIKRSHMHTADFLINGQVWEHKSPTGNGKRTMQNNLRDADDQSSFVIMDLRRCKMRPEQAMSRIRYELTKANKIKRLIVIQKNRRILELK